MQLLDRILQRTTSAAEPQKLGRHSEAGLLDRLIQELAERTAERNEARGRSDRHLHLLKQADAEVRRLRAILGEDAHLPAAQAPAPADTEGSCFNEPDPQPLPDGPRAVADTPTVAETYEPADPLAETQPTNVASLRNALGLAATQQLPVVSRVEPVPRVTWGVKDIPAGPGSSKPTEISEATGRRATVSVANALDEAS